jgi:PDZ domain
MRPMSIQSLLSSGGRIVACAMISLTLAGLPRAAHADVAAADIPMVFEDMRLFLPVASAHRDLGWFILDTGLSETAIDSGLQGTLGLTTHRSTTATGAGRGKLAIGLGSGTTLLLDHTQLKLPEVQIAPIGKDLTMFTGRKVGGIVGSELFYKYVVTLDFVHSRILLRDPQSFAYRGTGARVHFRLVEHVPSIDGTLTLPDRTRLPIHLLIDAGAKANLLIAEPFIAKYDVLKKAGPLVIEPLGIGPGGETYYAFARLPLLQIGNSPETAAANLIVGLSVKGTLRGGSFEGLLGSGFLRHYTVTFDYANKVAIFEPNGIAVPEEFDRSGAFLTISAGDLHKFVVNYVVPGSPAEESGLAVGDVITAISGRAAGTLTLNDVRSLLKSKPGQPLQLAIDHDAKRMVITLQLRDLIQNS